MGDRVTVRKERVAEQLSLDFQAKAKAVLEAPNPAVKIDVVSKAPPKASLIAEIVKPTPLLKTPAKPVAEAPKLKVAEEPKANLVPPELESSMLRDGVRNGEFDAKTALHIEHIVTEFIEKTKDRPAFDELRDLPSVAALPAAQRFWVKEAYRAALSSLRFEAAYPNRIRDPKKGTVELVRLQPGHAALLAVQENGQPVTRWVRIVSVEANKAVVEVGDSQQTIEFATGTRVKARF